jgi:hypothetical protein
VHRQEAIARMLLEADRTGFVSHLRRSAELRLEFLFWTYGRERDTDYARLITATRCRQGPFWDALATGDVDLARRVAVASVAPFDERYEYEDDHDYGQLFFDLVTSGFQPSARLPAIVSRIETIVDGQPSARLDVCKALLGRDQGALADALQKLVAEHVELFRAKGEGLLADPDEFATERFISIEGLGIKVAATQMGIAVADEDRLMPREALMTVAP